ncbi:MAG: hypothetical protein VB022_10875 [Rikenellaceae bacterium]|nr:hypothetical protein [Rikenellaceae bacterium]
MTKILVEFKEKTLLAKLFSVSRVTINAALRFKTNSALAQNIRAAALARGGKQTDN